MKPRKVLVVDDSKLLHRMFEMMLRQYPLVHAYDGREGLDRLAENRDVDLILLDVNMPRMNGLEFLAAVKQDPAFAKIPVIIVTTEGAEKDADKGLAEYEHQVGRLMNLYVATYQLHATLDPAEVQSTIAEIAINLLGAERFVLLFWKESESGECEIALSQGMENDKSGLYEKGVYAGGDPAVDATLSDG